MKWIKLIALWLEVRAQLYVPTIVKMWEFLGAFGVIAHKKLDTNIEEYKGQLLEQKHQLYQKAISNIYAKQELIKHKIVKHKKYYEIYNNVILEALPYKAVNIDSTQKFIVEI